MSASRYCELYRAFEARLSPAMRQSHVAGERLFVDYAGTTLEVIDGTTGEAMTAQLFVAVLGAPLFIRTTRSVGPTEAGERFLARAKPAFEELVEASRVARDLGQRPTGLLRLAVPRAVVPILLEPLLASFAQDTPRSRSKLPPARSSLTLPPKVLMPASEWASSSLPT